MSVKSIRLFALAAIVSAVLIVMAQISLARTQADEDAETMTQMELFGQVLALVQHDYIEDVGDSALITGALNGALESLDPHSHYVPPVEFEERQKSARREYGGLGIEVVMEDGLVGINYVTPNSPASRAGLKAGDKIAAVEGESVKGKTLSEAVEGMRGLEGDPITITVIRADKTKADMTLIREIIQGRAVRQRTVEGMGYLRIETFNNPNLARDVKIAINLLKSDLGEKIPGLIIDVRGNPGGMVEQVVKVTGYFLDGGEVFSARGRTKENTQRYNAENGEVLAGVPIVVLINSRSASASEILAGALQDRNRAMVVGRRSFGKGSVQSVMQLDEGGALRLTTQRYYTPSGRSIQGLGIMPDYLVAVRPDEDQAKRRFRENDLANALSNPNEAMTEEDYSAMDFPPEDWPEDEDYQLHRAVELLNSPDYMQKLASRNLLQ